MCVQISSKVINQTRGNGGRRERLGQYLPVVLICLIHSDLCTVKGSFSLTPPPQKGQQQLSTRLVGKLGVQES